MKLLGYTFTEMTAQEWEIYRGAEPHTLICHLDDRDLLYNPASGVLSEVMFDQSGSMVQRDWIRHI
jgi:hypothetical protein